jgi:DNA-binding transcriptional LysR family regulator
MDTLTRIRAFHRCCRSRRLFRCRPQGRPIQGVAVEICPRTGRRPRALLLNRTTRQFSLTEAGHTYYRTASDILKEIDNLADLVREGRRISRAGFGFGAAYIRGCGRRPVADRFCAAHPDVTLESFPTTASSILSRRAMMWPSASPGLRIRAYRAQAVRFSSDSPARHPSFSRNTARSPILRSLAASPALSTPMGVSQQLAV